MTPADLRALSEALDKARQDVSDNREAPWSEFMRLVSLRNALDEEFVNACVNAIRAQLAGEAGEDARDAARYRWLRDRGSSLETIQRDKGVINGLSCYHDVGEVRELKHGTDLDAAIDAALPAQPNEDKPL